MREGHGQLQRRSASSRRGARLRQELEVGQPLGQQPEPDRRRRDLLQTGAGPHGLHHHFGNEPRGLRVRLQDALVRRRPNLRCRGVRQVHAGRGVRLRRALLQRALDRELHSVLDEGGQRQHPRRRRPVQGRDAEGLPELVRLRLGHDPGACDPGPVEEQVERSAGDGHLQGVRPLRSQHGRYQDRRPLGRPDPVLQVDRPVGLGGLLGVGDSVAPSR